MQEPASRAPSFRQSPRNHLGNIQQLWRAFAFGGQRILEHGIAEGAGGGDGLCAGCCQFRRAVVADALAGLLAEKSKPAAGSATEAALAVAPGFDEFAGQRRNRARLLLDFAVAAQVSGIVEDDLLRSDRGQSPQCFGVS